MSIGRSVEPTSLRRWAGCMAGCELQWTRQQPCAPSSAPQLPPNASAVGGGSSDCATTAPQSAILARIVARSRVSGCCISCTQDEVAANGAAGEMQTCEPLQSGHSARFPAHLCAAICRAVHAQICRGNLGHRRDGGRQRQHQRRKGHHHNTCPCRRGGRQMCGGWGEGAQDEERRQPRSALVLTLSPALLAEKDAGGVTQGASPARCRGALQHQRYAHSNAPIRGCGADGYTRGRDQPHPAGRGGSSLGVRHEGGQRFKCV